MHSKEILEGNQFKLSTFQNLLKVLLTGINQHNNNTYLSFSKNLNIKTVSKNTKETRLQFLSEFMMNSIFVKESLTLNNIGLYENLK